MDAVGLLLNQVAETLPESRTALRRLKARVAAQTGRAFIRNDRLLTRYREEVAAGQRRRDEHLERILALNTVRSESGVATVTVITQPYPCPGRCIYCPTEARAPKSYLTNEPAVMRAVRSDYDPCRQVRSRLEALHETGHATDKIELIIKGGTWSFYPAAYQQEFIRRCFEAANAFAEGSGFRALGTCPPGPTITRAGAGQPRAPSPEPTQLDVLEMVQRTNETARSRVVGLTIETRPDYVDDAEILRLRGLGVTRVELGVQTLDEEVLTLIVRDHGTREVRAATRRLKDAGFKVAYHLMPNLPGATPDSDLESARRLFTAPDYQPDAIKLYPCVVVKTADLYGWWQQGRYAPYDDETLCELLIAIKQQVPPYVRIERVIRDIPSTSIEAGCLTTNLREEVLRRMRARGLHCQCIRCRQVRGDADEPFVLTRRTYRASDGTEVFLSFEDPQRRRLASFVRLRVPACAAGAAGRPSSCPPLFPALEGAALIRELHTYGRHVPLHERRQDAAQHHGYGARLLQEAERIAWEEFGRRRVAVIAGVGVRDYYRRLGYELRETYMVKELQPK